MRDETVQTVMRHFFAEHPIIKAHIEKNDFPQLSIKTTEDVQCEEAILEAFGK